MKPNPEFKYKDCPDIPIIVELRDILKKYTYHNIRLDTIYKYQFMMDYKIGIYTQTKTSLLNIVLLRIYLLAKLLLVIFKRKPDTSMLEGSVLVETRGVERRLKGFWNPLIENQDNFKITLLSSPGIEDNVGKDQSVLFTSSLRGNFIHLYLWYFKNYRFIIHEIRKVCMKYNLNNNSPELIFNTILSSTLLIEQYHCLFEKQKPSAFVAMDDQYVFGAVISNLLNLYSVPTYTHIHGAFGKQTIAYFLPLNAKFAFCWGEYMKQLFINEGVGNDRLLVVGCQRTNIKSEISNDQISQLKTKIGIRNINLSKPVILFGFNVIITENWVNDLKSLVNKLTDTHQLICRLHPSSSFKDLRQFDIESTPELIISESAKIGLNEHIALAEFVIVDTSTIGFDALMQGKIVVILDSVIEIQTQDVLYDAIRVDAAILCRSVTEVIKFLNNHKKQMELKVNAKAFVSRYISSYGIDAAKNIINEVTNRINL